NLTDAKLIRSRLRGANLAETDLTGANMKGANLSDISQDKAIFCNTIMSDGRVERSGC
ncbi:MAG: low-complexity protein, partial [Marinovum sp.]|nr:low-complexity protein [Marinovum sp.]